MKASKPCGGQLSGRLEADVVAGQGSKWSPALKAAELMPTSQMPSKPRLGGAGTRRGLSPSPSQLLPKTLPPPPDPLCTSQGSRQCWVAAPTGSGSRILWCLAAGPGTAAPRHPSCPGWWGNILNVRAASSLGTLSVEAMVRAVSLVLNCDSEALVPAHVERSLAETPACVVHLGAGHWSTIALLPVCCFLLPLLLRVAAPRRRCGRPWTRPKTRSRATPSGPSEMYKRAVNAYLRGDRPGIHVPRPSSCPTLPRPL